MDVQFSVDESANDEDRITAKRGERCVCFCCELNGCLCISLDVEIEVAMVRHVPFVLHVTVSFEVQ